MTDIATNQDEDSEYDDVLVPEQYEVKVYLNNSNAVVLSRALQDWERFSGDQDSRVAIIIPKFYVPLLIEKLKELMAAAN